MQKKLINLTSLLFLLLVIYIIFSASWRVRDRLFEIKYDWLNENPAIESKGAIEDIIKTLEITDYSKLDQEYLTYTKSNAKKYTSLLNNLSYYKVKRNDLNRRIVGDFRLKTFICKDKYYQDCILNKRSEIFCIFNKKIFFKTLELLQELENAGYDKYAFEITNGHRHPRYNENVGGAKLSRHIKGEAVDIQIYDIDKNGRVNKKDKDIVLDLLENKIIKNQGGIGLYPGTGSVHYDVRGVRARWNSY